jgi:hypothetical protein
MALQDTTPLMGPLRFVLELIGVLIPIYSMYVERPMPLKFPVMDELGNMSVFSMLEME